jgi:peptidoglycan/xylan/chitin deacetylase (PgdA/CDA1 family)
MKKIRTLILTVAALCIIGWGNAWFGERAVSAVQEKEQAVPLPVFMYHSVGNQPEKAGDYVITAAQFRADLEYLRQQGYQTISLSELVDYVEEEEPLPEKPVLITLDDGFYNNYCYVYPILQETKNKAVISVVGSFTEAASPEQENPNWSYLTAQEIGELAASEWVEIENHSYDFHHTRGRKGCLRKKGENMEAYQILFRNDTMKNQKLLKACGVPYSLCYTYPYGAYSKDTEEMLKEMGYLCTLSCQEGINAITHKGDCLYLMKRYNRPWGKSSPEFLQPILKKAEAMGGEI